MAYLAAYDVHHVRVIGRMEPRIDDPARLELRIGQCSIMTIGIQWTGMAAEDDAVTPPKPVTPADLPNRKGGATVADVESRSVPGPDPAAARAALDDVAAAEARVADLVRTPWWYRVGLALCMGVAVAYQGVGDSWQDVLFGRYLSGPVVLCCVVLVPLILTGAANQSTGVSLDRYRSRPAAVLYGGVVVLLVAGLWVRWGLHMPWAMVVAGIGAFLLTLIMEPRIDDAARRKLRTGQ